jgi:anti-sigma factor ChrR (cupin superfamily)
MREVIAKTFEVEWDTAASYPAGTQWKVLRRGSHGEPKTILLKLAPGFEMASHSHVHVEHHYVLSGEYESQGERFLPATYRVIPKHMNHGPFRSATGAELLVVWED